MEFLFEGRRVLITGAAGGLGSAIVTKFVERGATVFALDCNEQATQKLKSEIPTVNTILVDLTKWDEVRQMVEDLGPMDHLVNNAGKVINDPILNVSEGTLDSIMNTNFKAAFNLSQIFCKNVIANSIQGATIVNVSSIVSVLPGVTASTYSCSKAALSMMTKGFAVEMGPHDIRVNAILPTAMDTPFYSNHTREMVIQTLDYIVGKTPIPKVLETNDAANLVLYLSSSMSKMITGTCIPIDGGILCSL